MENGRREQSDGSQPPPAAPRAKAAYVRNLPHMQNDGSTLFITFSTRHRWVLPPVARDAVLEHCLHDRGTRIAVHAAVAMPDHVHIVLTPLKDPCGDMYGLAEIMSGIKGAAAHTVNRMLGRRGTVWEPESFDRVLRSDENTRQKLEYVCANPVRARLVGQEDEYRWLWREWVEGPADRFSNPEAR